MSLWDLFLNLVSVGLLSYEIKPLILVASQSSPNGNTFQLFVSVISFFWSLPTVPDHRWGWEYKFTSYQKALLPRLLAQLSLHRNRALQSLYYCRCCTDPPVDLLLRSSITPEQEPKILKLLDLRQNLITNLKRAFYPFLTENHGLQIWRY